jgi:intein/homing endonuclease
MSFGCSDFAEHALGLTLWPKQKQIVNELFEDNITHGVWCLGRRCVVADTLVATSAGLVEIGSLAGTGKPIDNEWENCDLEVAQPRSEIRHASLFYKGGKQDIVRIRTSRGFEIAGTPNHPVMVMSEKGTHKWRALGDLRKGDQIVTRPGADVWPDSCPSIAEFASKAEEAARLSPYSKDVQLPSCLNEDFAYVLGVLVGDGSWTVKTGLQATSHIDDAPFMLKSLAKGLGVSFKAKPDSRRSTTFRLDFCSHHYRRFLDDLGWTIDVQRDQKRIPWVIMQSPKEIVCAFLSGLFDTDGGVESGGKTISFSTACKTLAKEVHMLLFNLGIISTIKSKRVKGKDYWIIALLGLESRQQFCSSVGFRLPRKQLKAIDGLNVAKDGGNSLAIPHQKEWLKQLTMELKHRRGDGLLSQIRACVGNAIKGGGEEFNARRLPGLIKLLDDNKIYGEAAQHFRDLAGVRYFYDPVTSIQKEDPQEVFDFHVPVSNAFIANGIVSHNSGKTLLAAVSAVYMCFVMDEHFRRKVRKSEKWFITTVANDLSQAKIALDNIRQLIVNSPFEQEIIRETAFELEISNNCVFQAIPASARASRGKAVACAIFDEVAFSLDTDANRGARALFDALQPSIAQFGKHGKILELSSPWVTDGVFFEHFMQGQSGEYPGMRSIRVPTWEININLPYDCDFLTNARKKDPETFAVEFGAEFRRSNSVLLAPEVVDIAVNKDRSVLPPRRELMGTYFLSLDPARGGVGRDEYIACIIHYEGQRLIVDKLHTFEADFEIGGKKEVSIAKVEEWIKEHHRLYEFQSITLDQFNSSAIIQDLSKDFPISELAWSVSTKMKAFSKVRELFNAGLIELYPHKKLIWQLKNLSVLYRASGQWAVTGGKESGVDDYCFALAAAVLDASKDDNIDWINSLVR